MNSDKIYEITLWKHLKYIWISLMFFLIVPGFYIYSLIQKQYNGSFLLFLIPWIGLGMFYIIGFRLHLSYYLNDKNKKIIIDNLKVTICEDEDSYSFAMADIDTITNHHSGLNNRTPWNEYEFSTFRLKNGKEYIITCLLLDLETITDKFSKIKVIKKNHFIATLNKF